MDSDVVEQQGPAAGFYEHGNEPSEGAEGEKAVT